MKDNQVGDLAGVAGLVITVVGFIATLIGVRRSKKAAERAEAAAKETRESMHRMDSAMSVTSAVGILEEIVRLHTQKQWSLALDRYAQVRRLLAAIAMPGMIVGQTDYRVDALLSDLRQIERLVERAVGSDVTAKLNASKFNDQFRGHIEALLIVVNELKSDETGV